MVAVLLVAGSLNAYAVSLEAFDAHEHAGHGQHVHGPQDDAAGHDHGDAPTLADAASGEDHAPGNCGLCKHMHAHSCCAYAVPATDLILKLAHARASVPVAVSHIPPGQLAAPLFRPPRAVA